MSIDEGISPHVGEPSACDPQQGSDTLGLSRGQPHPNHEAATRLLSLTDRQRELLAMVATGIEASKALSRQTGLSPATIDNHLSRAARVLGAKNRKEAAGVYVELSRSSQEWPAELVPSAPAVEEFQENKSLWKKLTMIFVGPPLGGDEPLPGWSAVSLEVLWVAFVGLAALMALTLFVLAFFKTFG